MMNSEVANRIKELRKIHLQLSGEKFGEALGVTNSAISLWERGSRDIPDSIIKLICKTWDVDYYWLTEGFNQPFLQFPDDILDDMTRRYSMSDEESYILKSYVNLDEEDRTAIQNILKKLIKKTD